jgi:alcohol dehydrogenase (cytochrome c)
MFYVPVQDVGSEVTLRHREFKESIPYWGASVTVDADDMQGFVKAISAATGEEVWRWRNDVPMSASVLATAGDLVFAGRPSGEFHAFHARTGESLWQFQTGSGHHSNPTTYSVDGRQYIAVPVGWGSWVEGIVPAMLGASHGDAVFAFALPQ